MSRLKKNKSLIAFLLLTCLALIFSLSLSSAAASTDPKPTASFYVKDVKTFDGKKTYEKLNKSVSNVKEFSFAGWVYWTGTDPWARIFDLGASDKFMWLSPKDGVNNKLRFDVWDGTNGLTLLGKEEIKAKTWTHIAVTLNSKGAKLYVNGKVVDKTTTVKALPNTLGYSENTLGKSKFEADPYFAGKMKKVYFYDKVLTDKQVATLAADKK